MMQVQTTDFIMDTNLIPFKKMAELGDPTAILKLADAYWLGQGVPYNPIKAGEYYQLLADHNTPLDFVEYEYLNIILGDVAMLKRDYTVAVKRYKKAYQIFIKKHGSLADDLMQEVGFLDRFQQAIMFQNLEN
jgi:hypothetical protein